jgi:hypothetical protein
MRDEERLLLLQYEVAARSLATLAMLDATQDIPP